MKTTDYQARIAALEKENRILKKKLGRSEANRAMLEELLETHSITLKVRNAELENSRELLRQSEAKYRDLALHDTVTGLPNRILFQERLTSAIGYAKKSNSIIALLYVDLDRFKPGNDSWGHEAGDMVLRKIAERLRTCIRGEDMVARIGGDEFAVLMENLVILDDVRALAERILAMIAEPISLDVGSCVLGASIGISCYPMDGVDVNTLLQKADTAMYSIKKSGRKSYCFFGELESTNL